MLITPGLQNSGPRRAEKYPGRPVADYEATDSVEIHYLTRELAPELWSAVSKHGRARPSSFGYSGPRSGYSDPNLIWLRDFAPLYVEKDGQLEARKFLSLNPTRQSYQGSGSVPVSPPTPDHHFVGKPGDGGGFVKFEMVPLLADGGDLVPVGETLIIGQRVISRNGEEHQQPHLVEAGYRPREAEEVKELLKRSTGAEEVVVIPWWPGDKTGHADMPVQALADGEVLVPEIRGEALGVLDYGHEREHGGRVQDYLNQVAGQLSEAGLKVRRLPMMAPVNLTPGPYGWDAKSYTPANAYRGENFICIPTFDANAFPLDYQGLKESYEEEWRTFYQDRGLEAEVLEATESGKANGLFHCLTAGVPRITR